MQALLQAESIPVREPTLRICAHFQLDPLRLISSGSMLMACADGEDMVRHLEAAGIPASVIGRVMGPHAFGNPHILLQRNGITESVDAPGADELYRVL